MNTTRGQRAVEAQELSPIPGDENNRLADGTWISRVYYGKNDNVRITGLLVGSGECRVVRRSYGKNQPVAVWDWEC